MPAYPKAELEAALAHYTKVVEGCSASGDWSPFADLFTEDVHYTEHAYGEMDGRETVRAWITSVMAPFPHMRFPSDWTAYDEENGAVVMLIKNLLEHPTDPRGEPFWFPNWTRLGTCPDGTYAYTRLWFRVSRTPDGPIGKRWHRWAGTGNICETT